MLLDLLKLQRKRIANNEVDVLELVIGKSGTALPEGELNDPEDWAAYTIVARVLLNLDETITKE